MTKDQFMRRRLEFEKRDRRFNAIYLVIFFAILIAAIPLAGLIPEGYALGFTVGYLILLFANAAVMVRRGRNQALREGLVCRICKGGLLGIPGNIAIATGNCPHCGQRAFVE